MELSLSDFGEAARKRGVAPQSREAELVESRKEEELDRRRCSLAKHRWVPFAGFARGRRSAEWGVVRRGTPRPAWPCQGRSQQRLGGEVCPGVQQPGVREAAFLFCGSSRMERRDRHGPRAGVSTKTARWRVDESLASHASLGNRIASTLSQKGRAHSQRVLRRGLASRSLCLRVYGSRGRERVVRLTARGTSVARGQVPCLLPGGEGAEGERDPPVAWAACDVEEVV